MPSVIVTAPSTSYPWRSPASSERLSGTMRGVSASTAAPIGTLTKNTQRQLKTCTIRPPSSSPIAPPAPAIAPHTASARLRSCPSAKVVRMIDSAAGETSAPPSPCRPLAASSMPWDCETPQTNEAPEKSAIPATNSRLLPSRSASRPPSKRNPPKMSVYAFKTQGRFCSENPRSVLIVGSATFTMVASRITMNWATATSARTAFASTLRLGRAAGEAAAADMGPSPHLTANRSTANRSVSHARSLRRLLYTFTTKERAHMVYTTFESPLGELLAAGDGRELQVLSMKNGRTKTAIRPEWREDAAPFADVREQLAEYFAGARRDFEMRLAPAGSPFQLRVWRELREIRYGETISYGELARRVGAPATPRNVGWANGRNPIAVIVPCHRVIGADGSLTGYGGGLDRKRLLLELESGVLSLA